jgi:hypothetical protein
MRVVDIFTTAGITALTTGTKLGGVGPDNTGAETEAGAVGALISAGLLTALGSQSKRELKTMPATTPVTRNTPAIMPTLNERRSNDMNILLGCRLFIDGHRKNGSL